MQKLFLIFIIAFSIKASAQHCPWDCTGLILIQTDMDPREFGKMNMTLVDSSKKVMVDTLFGTGRPTYDTCRLMQYDDFMNYRIQRIQLHYWYQYDTVYKFAKGLYLARFNYCQYKNSPLYLNWSDVNGKSGTNHYFEISPANRIHLHDFSRQLNNRDYDQIRREINPKIIRIRQRDLKLGT
jgi:hypothetical protein